MRDIHRDGSTPLVSIDMNFEWEEANKSILPGEAMYYFLFGHIYSSRDDTGMLGLRTLFLQYGSWGITSVIYVYIYMLTKVSNRCIF